MQYQNISKEEQSLVGFGLVKPGSTVEAPEGLGNPNFRPSGAPQAAPAPAPAPAAEAKVAEPSNQPQE
jgi:ABC-type uncharacterized transport system involved in gliding motility auxiliary subunit